jgi:hypothetical protein
MSNEQWEYLRLAVFAAAVAACFWYLSRQPEDPAQFPDRINGAEQLVPQHTVDRRAQKSS